MRDFLFGEQGKEFLLREYEANGRSARALAGELSVSPRLIRKALDHHGIKVRTRGEARKLLKRGPLTSVARQNASDGQAKRWVGLTHHKKKRLAVKARKAWRKLSRYRRNRLQSKAGEGLGKASHEGSKLELALFEGLSEHYPVYHRVSLGEAKVDLYLPGIGVVILVDGPAHFRPIWGPARLEKIQEKDEVLRAKLIEQGLSVIRVRNNRNYLSSYRLRKALENVLGALQTPCSFIEVEV